MGINKVLLVALVAQLLCAAALAYVTLPMNAKSELSLDARALNQRRSSDNPLGGGPRIGYYYVELEIGSQTFRVDIVRLKTWKSVSLCWLSLLTPHFSCFCPPRILAAPLSTSSDPIAIMYAAYNASSVIRGR